MSNRIQVVDKSKILEMAHKLEAMTNERPILITDRETLYSIVNIEIPYINGIPQRILNFYGYSVVIFPNDSKFENGMVYFYSYEQAKNAVVEYLNDKAQDVLKELKSWVFDEVRV